MNNPFGLSDRQCEALDALTRHGCTKLAANELQVVPKVANEIVRRAVVKMGVRTPLLAVLEWDRLGREPR